MKQLFYGLVFYALVIPAFAGWKENSLAAVLVAEAGGEGRVGMEAVAEVLMARAQREHRTLDGVFLSRGVVSCLLNTTPTKLYLKFLREQPKTLALALTVAVKAYRDPKSIPRRVKGATFYENKRLPKPAAWPDNLVAVAVIGNHRFWKEY